MKRILAGGLLTLSLTAAGSTLASPMTHGRHCRKLYTIPMGERAARATYAGAGTVTLRQLRYLGYLERCQRRPGDQPALRAYDRRLDREHQARRQARIVARSTVWQGTAIASWYDDAGSTACGFHAAYGVANKTLPCGTQVTFGYAGRIVTATVDDRGPYIAGREWDLNQTTAAALGFSGVAGVEYSVR